jgi:SpoVK/Ycf46/Vps4 family AAA+-type ATPase
VESCKRGDDADDSHVKDFARFLTKPDLKLADVGGHFLVKRRLHQVLAYLKGDPAMLEWGAEIPRGILLVGPPGVGKTHLAMCLAGEAKCPFYDPPMSIFEDKWAGNEQKSLRRLFDQACQHQQAIIHFSEFDSLGAARVSAHDGNAWYNRVVGCLLDLFDALARRPNRVVVIATSNYRENIDKAFLRPGRFSYTIELGLPTARELAEIWLIHLDTAARRAERLDFMTDELVQAVQADRQTWVQRAFAPDGEDPCGIVPLANLSERKGLVGDDVRECIRRVIDERVIASVECDLDLGPIGPRDLMEQLQSYIAARIADG